jgi:hypothetical protein
MAQAAARQVKWTPEDVSYLNDLGELRRQAGDTEGALVLREKAITLGQITPPPG